jgi:uncharacterized RDD family membrane protein YckC
LEDDFETLRRDGTINSETPVWREGMTDWQTLGQVQAEAAAPPSRPEVPPPLGQATSDASVVCSQCGGRFPPGEVIHYGDTAVCASCKPIFVQKLKEGANLVSGLEFAGFWTRFAAYFVDGIITGIAGGIIGAVVGTMFPTFPTSEGIPGNRAAGAIIAGLLSMGLGFALRAAYFIYFTGKTGQTPGKMMCKIRVVNADGSQISYPKATGRFFGYFLSSLILCIGFLMAAWDDEKRALHDRLCDTRVIKTS